MRYRKQGLRPPRGRPPMNPGPKKRRHSGMGIEQLSFSEVPLRGSPACSQGLNDYSSHLPPSTPFSIGSHTDTHAAKHCTARMMRDRSTKFKLRRASGAAGSLRRSSIEAGHEQHCFGTSNSSRLPAQASGSCPRSWMSPSVGAILGRQGHRRADQCRLYAREHRAGA
jgi:hypothetical protein